MSLKRVHNNLPEMSYHLLLPFIKRPFVVVWPLLCVAKWMSLLLSLNSVKCGQQMNSWKNLQMFLMQLDNGETYMIFKPDIDFRSLLLFLSLPWKPFTYSYHRNANRVLYNMVIAALQLHYGPLAYFILLGCSDFFERERTQMTQWLSVKPLNAAGQITPLPLHTAHIPGNVSCCINIS